jgi:hypothetical protein
LGGEVGRHCCALLVIVGFDHARKAKQGSFATNLRQAEKAAHIEEAGRLGVANFKTICNINPAIFGSPGRDLICQLFQKEQSNCLKHNPRNYLKVLLDYNITPSEQAIGRAETGLSNVIVFWFTFVAIVCSPFVVAGGST